MSTGLENLEIYKLAERLEIYIHKITETFPSDEKYRSVDQLRRSSSSAADNIAEAYGRYSYSDRMHRIYIARGEAEETRRKIVRCFKKGFLPKKTADFVVEKYTELIKGMNGYIHYLSNRKNNNKST